MNRILDGPFSGMCSSVSQRLGMVAEAEDVFGSGALPKKILADGSLSSEGRTPRGKLRMSQLHERWQRVAELPDHFEAPNTEPFDKVKTDTIRNCVTVPNGTAASAAP
jgi:hypothetical protein